MIFLFVLFLFLIALLLWNHFYWRAEAWPSSAFKLPLYQAHRGYWIGGARENTLDAFIAAKVQGYEMCELDVQITADGVPLVFHDETLNRMAGVVGTIADMTYERIISVYPAPTLQEVLLHPDVPPYFNIELKTRFKRSGSLEEAVVKVVRETKSEDRVLFSSFNPLCLLRLKNLLPQVPRALLATQEKAAENNFLLRSLCLAPYIGVHLLHLDHRYLSAQMIGAYKKRGVPVALWTVNDPEKAEEFLRAGAVGIISDSLKKEKA